MPHTVWTGLGAVLVLYCAFGMWLLVAGRRCDARAWAGLIPDCIVLVWRLMADPRVPRTRRLMIGALLRQPRAAGWAIPL